MINSYYVYKVKSFSSEHLFSKIKVYKLKLIEVKNINQFEYLIKVDLFNNKKIKEVFEDLILIEKVGIFFNLYDLFIKCNTIISIVISILFFLFCQRLVFDINIQGKSPYFTQIIEDELFDVGIKKYSFIPPENTLNNFKIKCLNKYIQLENIDFKMNGTILYIEYYLKDESVNIDDSNAKIYASKSGIIKESYIERGNFLFSINDYVKKGDLLIDDYIYLNNKSIFIGAKGEVFAYTWTLVEYKTNCNKEDYFDKLNEYLIKARYEISKDFNYGEYIDNENLLINSYQNGELYIKIHYTTVENIAKISKK